MEEYVSLATLAQTDAKTPIPKDKLLPVISSPPFLALPGTFNARDLGLVPGSPIRPGLVYRSGGFFMCPVLPEEAKTYLSQTLGVKKVFDLRSVREQARAPDPSFGQGIEGVWEKPDEEDAHVDLSEFVEGEGEKGYITMYMDVLKIYQGPIKKVLQWVRDGEGAPFLFHCTAGRDRTGVMAGILLTLAGADPNTIALDWTLTRIGSEPAREELIAFALKGSFAEDTKAPGFDNLVNLRVSCWEAFIEAAQEKYGGLEGYVTSTLGFSDEDVARIKDNLVLRN